MWFGMVVLCSPVKCITLQTLSQLHNTTITQFVSTVKRHNKTLGYTIYTSCILPLCQNTCHSAIAS